VDVVVVLVFGMWVLLVLSFGVHVGSMVGGAHMAPSRFGALGAGVLRFREKEIVVQVVLSRR
jgi:hypothetical protein